MSIAKPLIGNVLHGISVTLENHSIQKAFVKSYKIKLPKQRKVIQFLFEGFTGQPIVKAPLEPGQAFSFNIVMKNLKGAPDDLSEYGELIVTTDIGYEFKVPATIVREHVRELRRTEA